MTPLKLPYEGKWVSEGDKFGDELVSSGRSQDFVVHLSWEPGPRTAPGVHFRLVVTLESSNTPGSCTNSGELDLPDLTIDQERNPDWEVLGPDIPEYEGRQASNVKGRPAVPSARTRLLAAGERIELRVRCYDWLCFGVLRVDVESESSPSGSPPSMLVIKFPADLNENGLPDALEHRHR